VQLAAQLGERLPITGLGPELSRDCRPIMRPACAGNQPLARRVFATIRCGIRPGGPVEHSLCTEQPDDQHRASFPAINATRSSHGQQLRRLGYR
jgi:hypothetical protein